MKLHDANGNAIELGSKVVIISHVGNTKLVAGVVTRILTDERLDRLPKTRLTIQTRESRYGNGDTSTYYHSITNAKRCFVVAAPA